MMSQAATKERKRSFSSFNYKDAFKYLHLNELVRWDLAAEPVVLSDFFQQRLARLQRFDLDSLEVSKSLLIDAICEEALEECPRLKIWKGAALEGEDVWGNVDYLIAERRGYLEAPFVCVIEAKKDDFEQGTAQCLVEMKACQWVNQNMGKTIPIYGIVTNGEGWKFYRLRTSGEVDESLLSGIGDMAMLLGRSRLFFQLCQENLDPSVA